MLRAEEADVAEALKLFQDIGHHFLSYSLF